MEMFLVASIVVGLLGVLVWLHIFKHKKSLSISRKSHYESELKNALSMESTLGYITVDRLLEQLLSELHGKVPLGENLKRHYSKHSHRDELWKIHKIRNRLVHEGSVNISTSQVKEFAAIVKSIIHS